MAKNVDEYATIIGKRIGEEFINLNTKKYQEICSHVVRKINLSMSSVCEDVVAMLVADILKEKEYNYLIDANIKYRNNKTGKNESFRPDIIIINSDNEIVGIIEVKSQMGYCNKLSPKRYEEKCNNLVNSTIKISKKELNYIKENRQLKEHYNDIMDYYKRIGMEESSNGKEYQSDIKPAKKKLHYFVVNIMAQNHVNNVEGTIALFDHYGINNVHFYNLFGHKEKNDNSDEENGDIWYDSLGIDCIYDRIDAPDKKIKFDYKEDPDDKKAKSITIECNLTNKLRGKFGFEKFIDDIKKYV